MLSYVNYEYYTVDYEGMMPEEAFVRISKRASSFIKQITFGRAQGKVSDEVKDATCAVCDVIFENEQKFAETKGREIKSENNDGYSVSYVAEGKEGQTHEAVLNDKMYRAARMYLLHTGLLYTGVK